MPIHPTLRALKEIEAGEPLEVQMQIGQISELQASQHT